VDERGQVVSPPARRPGRHTGTGARAGYSLHASTVVAEEDREANAERPPSPSPKGANAGLAAALLSAGREVAETAMTVGTKRGELLGAATPKPWLDWATLLRRTYDLDVLACPCGGRLRFSALVTEREAIVPLLESLGLPTPPPVRARARSPTLEGADPMPVYA
jgi:hypothetical protein